MESCYKLSKIIYKEFTNLFFLLHNLKKGTRGEERNQQQKYFHLNKQHSYKNPRNHHKRSNKWAFEKKLYINNSALKK